MVKFKLNRKGVANLMKSSAMQRILSKKASEIKGRSGAGYGQDLHVGKNRANARVFPESSSAKRDNYKNNTLLKSVR